MSQLAGQRTTSKVGVNKTNNANSMNNSVIGANASVLRIRIKVGQDRLCNCLERC